MKRLLGIFHLLAVVLLLVSCRKVDDDLLQTSESLVESRFFKHSKTDPALLKLIKETQRLNSEQQFVEGFSKDYGFPIWDYSKIIKNGSKEVVFVPVVLDNKRTTNAIIRAEIDGQNISISSFTAADYKKFPFVEEGNSASNVAALFIQFDFKLFKTREFEIIDQRLFTPWKATHGSKRIIHIDKVESNSQRTSSCYEVTEYISWYERNDAVCLCFAFGWSECDYLDNCTQSPPCYIYHVATVSYWAGDCGGGGGGPTTWSPYPPTSGGGDISSGDIGSVSAGWVPIPNDSRYDDFLTTLTTSQETFWSNPNNSEYIAPLINLLVQEDYSLEIQGRIRDLVTFLLSNTITPSRFIKYFLSPAEPDGTYNSAFWDDPNLDLGAQVPFPKEALFFHNWPKKKNNQNKWVSKTHDEVYADVGGTLNTKHVNGDPEYFNACALRGSWAFNYSGHSIGSWTSVEQGGDGKNYILQAKAFHRYCEVKFTGTSATLEPWPGQSITLEQINNFVKNRSGLYTILLSPPGATGHVDLLVDGEPLGHLGIPTDLSKIIKIQVFYLPK